MDNTPQPTISQLVPGFIEYLTVEQRFSPATVAKYRENILLFMREVGEVPITDIGFADIVSLKGRMAARGAREARVASVIFAIKSLLNYVRDVLDLPVLDSQKLRAPRSPRREVVYLSNDELRQFLETITLQNSWTGQPHLTGYCFRATAMRISEALTLDRDQVDFEAQEATILGKGRKVRSIYFTGRALDWLRRYFDLRRDSNPAVFATSTGRRLQVRSAEAMFQRIAAKAGMDKRVSPHTLRHTAATRLLRNGCPIGFIKEVLGHERLETTCRFYLGVLDKAETKKAFRSYMNYDLDHDSATATPLPERGRAQSIDSSPGRTTLAM